MNMCSYTQYQTSRTHKTYTSIYTRIMYMYAHMHKYTQTIRIHTQLQPPFTKNITHLALPMEYKGCSVCHSKSEQQACCCVPEQQVYCCVPEQQACCRVPEQQACCCVPEQQACCCVPEQQACCCVPAPPCSSSSDPSQHGSPPPYVLSALPPPAGAKTGHQSGTHGVHTLALGGVLPPPPSLSCKHSLPVNGSSFQPLVRMGVEGVAWCTGCFHSSCIIRILPHIVLATKTSPRRKVPCWMRTVATGLRDKKNQRQHM